MKVNSRVRDGVTIVSVSGVGVGLHGNAASEHRAFDRDAVSMGTLGKIGIRSMAGFAEDSPRNRFTGRNGSEILIVGAGGAGLAAAWKIAAARPRGDCRVRVPEATDRIGGRAFCEEIEADAVICATTASAAVRIVPDLREDVRGVLERVRYSSCCYVAFGLEENILADGAHAALFPPGSPTFLTMVSNLAATAPEIAPAGKTLVHALVIGERTRALFDFDDDEIVHCMLTEMRRFFPGMPERPLYARVYRWPEAICLSPGGLLRDVHDMRRELRRSIQGLYLAGDYTRLPSLNGAIKSGIEAARASLFHVDSASRGETRFSR